MSERAIGAITYEGQNGEQQRYVIGENCIVIEEIYRKGHMANVPWYRVQEAGWRVIADINAAYVSKVEYIGDE